MFMKGWYSSLPANVHILIPGTSKYYFIDNSFEDEVKSRDSETTLDYSCRLKCNKNVIVKWDKGRFHMDRRGEGSMTIKVEIGVMQSQVKEYQQALEVGRSKKQIVP